MHRAARDRARFGAGKIKHLFVAHRSRLAGYYALAAKRPATFNTQEAFVYRLMKSEKYSFDNVVEGSMSSYHQTELERFPQFSAALAACKQANDKAGGRHYVLNDLGKEYFQGVWIE